MKGKVKKGLGQGNYWITKFIPIFFEMKNIKLFPGTLNVELSERYIIYDNYDIVEGKKYGGTEEVLIKRCRVNNDNAFIVRTKKNNSENGDHPLNIVEIISDINFREKYNLKDDDIIEINILEDVTDERKIK